MSAGDVRSYREGLLGGERETPSRLSASLRLYRSDLLFRGLCDLVLAGCLVLLFSANWGAIATSLSRGAALPFDWGGTAKSRATAFDVRVGNQIAGSIGTMLAADRKAVERSGDPNADKLLAIIDAVEKDDLKTAIELVKPLDDANPLVAYVKASAVIRMPGRGRIGWAQSLLRKAASEGVAPAHLMLGALLYHMTVLDSAGLLPKDERVIADDAKVVYPASVDELSMAAATWWEKAASYGQPEGLRMAGFAKARGLSGKSDLVAASALWRSAAQAGDALSQYELANMYMFGIGVHPDTEQAAKYFRLAQAEIPLAGLQLATVLLPASIGGDAAAGAEAVAALETATRRLTGEDERATAHMVLGEYLQRSAPLSLRQPARAIDEFEKSARLGYKPAALVAADAYRAGRDKPKDAICAYAFYLAGRDSDASRIDRLLAEVGAEIGDAGITDAKKISERLEAPQPSAMTDEHWRSVCEASPAF